jgi:hypothetical protein
MGFDSRLRVSVAALCRVVFPHPLTGEIMLALERHIARSNPPMHILTQPFGGGLRILDPAGFRSAIGDFEYDSQRSSQEQDLRILIPPAAWQAARQFILSEIQMDHPRMLETSPCRELEEEFLESAGVSLLPQQYSYHSIGISIQDQPTPTPSPRMPGALTVRIYRIFEVTIHDPQISDTLIANSQHITDEKLHQMAAADTANGGWGRANGTLVLPLGEVRRSLPGTTPTPDGDPILLHGYALEPTTALLFMD